MSGSVRVTKNLQAPNEIGTHHRFLCMTGPNKGNVYYLTGKRIVVGRGERVDIQILDTNISREHAELSFADNAYTVTDLGAQNGVVVNDTKIKQQRLKDADKIVVGQTVFKYNIIKVKENVELAIAELGPDSALAKEIKKGVKVKVPTFKSPKEEVVEEDDPKTNKKTNESNKRRTIIFGIVILAVVFILFGDDEKSPKSKSGQGQATNVQDDFEVFNDNARVNRGSDDPEIRKKLDALIHSGRREFREGNYFRAMEEFRLALLLSPNHGQASFYLSKAKQRLDEEIARNFEKGTQEQDSKKYQAAIVSFCGVIQLIREYPNDERYKNAMLKLSSIESTLGMFKGEIKCFEEEPTTTRN